MIKYQALSRKLKIDFKDEDLLTQVFVHRSYLNENPGFRLENNERLEFLGDAVLELVATKFLYQNYTAPEGQMTAWRSALVRGRNLAKAARRLGLGELLLLSRGEERTGGRNREPILAGVFEALMGAIFLEKGIDGVERVIHSFLLSELPEILEKKLHLDPKTELQELSQAQTGITPSYQVLSEQGPDHAKTFTVGVYINNELLAKGTGSSKQIAQSKAATRVLRGWKESVKNLPRKKIS